MRCKFYENQLAMFREALRFAIDYEHDFIRAHLDIKGVWGDESLLDDSSKEAIADSRARIADWQAWLRDHEHD